MRYLLILLVVLSTSNSFAQNWESLDGPYGQIVTGISIAPNGSIFVSSYFNGVFKSNDGSGWTNSYPGDEYPYWSFVEVVGSTVLAGRPELIMRSTDNGDSWSVSTGSHSTGYGAPPSVIEVDNTLYLLYRGPTDLNYNDLYTSTDAGLTWDTLLFDVNGFYEVLAIDSASRVVLAGQHGFAVTDNFFDSFVPSSSLFDMHVNAIAADSLGKVWIATALDNGIAFSRDGANWTRGSSNIVDTFWSTAVTPRGIAYIGSSKGVQTSTDGGESWSDFNQGLPAGFVASYLYVGPDGHLYAGTNGAGIFKTSEPVNQAYAKIKELTVKERKSDAAVLIENGRLIIAAWPEANVSFIDVLGRQIAVDAERTDQSVSIRTADLQGAAFAVIREAGSSRLIRLPF